MKIHYLAAAVLGALLLSVEIAMATTDSLTQLLSQLAYVEGPYFYDSSTKFIGFIENGGVFKADKSQVGSISGCYLHDNQRRFRAFVSSGSLFLRDGSLVVGSDLGTGC
jgi:hypothetical protein